MLTPDDVNDHQLLGMANEKGKFAIEIGYTSRSAQEALERAFDNDWINLIDVSAVATVTDGRLMRIFKLTKAGHERLAQLKQKER